MSDVFEYIRTLTTRHRWAIVLAMAVACMYGSHHVFVPRFIDSATEVYYPITLASYVDEASFYALRAAAVFKGHLLVGDIALYEHQDSPSLMAILPPLVIGGLGRMLGSMKAGLIALDIIFPAIIFLLLYLITHEITGHTRESLLFASVFIFFPKIGILVPPVSFHALKELFLTFIPSLPLNSALYFSQFEEPKITFFFFLICFYLIARCLKRDERWSVIAAGVSFGLLFYTYLYDWATMLVSLGGMCLFFGVKKDYGRVKKIFIIAGIGFAVSIGYWISQMRLRSLPHFSELFARAAIEVSHRVRIASVWKSYARDIILSLLLWRIASKKNSSSVILLVCMLLSYFVVVNAQIVTGFNPQPDHWYRIQFFPVALSIVWLLLIETSERLRRIHTWRFTPLIMTLFFIYFFGGALWGQYAYSRDNASRFTLSRDFVKSYQWLDEHAKAGSVVGSVTPASNYDILLQTRLNVFLPIGQASVASDKETWERYFFLSAQGGVSPETFKRALEESGISYYLFTGRFADQSFDAFFHGGMDYGFPKMLIEEKTAEYARYLASPRDPKFPYRLDYIYVSGRERAFGYNPKLTQGLTNVYDDGIITIYQVMRQ